VQHAESLHLHRLQQGDDDALIAKITHHTAFVSACRLDSGARDARGNETGCERLPAGDCVRHACNLGVAMDGHVEVVLRGVNPRDLCGYVRHPR
jgi:hypothetical protein